MARSLARRQNAAQSSNRTGGFWEGVGCAGAGVSFGVVAILALLFSALPNIFAQKLGETMTQPNKTQCLRGCPFSVILCKDIQTLGQTQR